MVVLNRIYTRGGDKGETALGDGSRVPKTAPRVEAYGTVDEANACFGLAALYAGGEMGERIAAIQNDLFDLGADLCRPPRAGEESEEYPPLRVTEGQVARLESEIDQMNERLEPLRSFVLPGGSSLAAHLHMARVVTRRAERLCVALAGAENVNDQAVKYLNRLSDWCFVASRLANDGGAGDVLWQPGKTR